DRALRGVAALTLQVELGAFAAAEAADGAVVVRHRLDAPPLGWAASVVRYRCDVVDGAHLETRSLQRANGRLPTRTGAAHEDLDRPHPVLHGAPRRRFGGHLGGEGRRLAAALEALRPRRTPRDDVAS